MVCHNIGFFNKGSTAETRTGESDWSIGLGNRRVRNTVLHHIGELGIGFFYKGSTAATRADESDWSTSLGNRRVKNMVLHNIGE